MMMESNCEMKTTTTMKPKPTLLAKEKFNDSFFIRKTIISGIEGDDYSACGGDFYTRGHIRAIARAVGGE